MKKRIFAAVAGILIISFITAFGYVFAVSEVIEVYENGIDKPKLQSGSIAKMANIMPGDNILSIDETDAIKNVSDNFPDNSIDIMDIERIFPNKVIITIKQRLPVVAITAESGGYALADIDFQLNKKVTEANFESLIFAEGLTVTNTFNTPEIKRLRDALLAVKAAGFTDEGLTAFVESIRLGQANKVEFLLRSGGAIWVEGTTEQLIAQFAAKYETYLSLNDAMRREAYL